MRIVIVTTYLSGGGAAIAAVRHAEALHEQGYGEVSLLYLYDPEKVASRLPFHTVCYADGVVRRWKTLFFFYAERIQIFLANGGSSKRLFHISTGLWGIDLSTHPLVQSADIVHLHWVCQGFVSLPALQNLHPKVVVWTLHDMWPITAVSPHLKVPDRYESPWQGKERPLVERVWKTKQEVYTKLRPTFVGCSRWISLQAACSPLTRSCRIFTVPNPIDLTLYHPKGEWKPRSIRRLLFAAITPCDPRKGYHLMLECLKKLQERGILHSSLEVICVGHLSAHARKELSPYVSHFLGYVSSASDMVDIYQDCDIYVNPSLFENLPNTIMESLACGTPVVAFRTGGIPEMIVHEGTGMICEYGSSESLVEGILKILDLPPDEYRNMRTSCYTRAGEHYSYPSVASHWKDIYTRLLQDSSHRDHEH